ncbi:hypothetical protein cypCar_00008151, partial [Cyprinus carpio]
VSGSVVWSHVEGTQPYPGSLPAGGLQCRERNRRSPLQTSSRVEDRRGGAHEERSWTCDGGGLPPGQLIVLLRASIECSLCTRRIYLIQLVEYSSRLNDLLLKFENQGYVNINYMVVNNRDERSQQLHHLLKERLMNITLYAQDLSQPDVWQAVNVEKDDILVYDRCGRLTYHLSLPYTILSHPHVEEAIRRTYCDGVCGECSIEVKQQLL